VWSDPAWRFLIRYPIFTALAFSVPACWPALGRALIRATLQSLNVASAVFPAAVQLTGSQFRFGVTAIEIAPDCTPLFPILLLSGGILAFPAPWRWRAIGLLAGASVLWLYNLVRIYVLMAVLRYAPGLFDLAHVFLWQSATLLMVVACFLLWIRAGTRHAART
jgi:exosortase/archaeosortase family protein